MDTQDYLRLVLGEKQQKKRSGIINDTTVQLTRELTGLVRKDGGLSPVIRILLEKERTTLKKGEKESCKCQMIPKSAGLDFTIHISD